MSFWRSLGLTREKKSNLEVLGWEWGAVCGFEVIQMLLSLKGECGTGGVQSTDTF